jgi:acylphosphatase
MCLPTFSPSGTLQMLNFSLSVLWLRSQRNHNKVSRVWFEHRGFRNFIKAKADELGVTGTIQRYRHNDVQIEFEGTNQQVGEFLHFLRMCRGQGMIQNFTNITERKGEFLHHDNFQIVTDLSRTVERGGRVIKGQYSDSQYDKISEYSADSPFLRGSQVGDYL